jgi:hypothetical protein
VIQHFGADAEFFHAVNAPVAEEQIGAPSLDLIGLTAPDLFLSNIPASLGEPFLRGAPMRDY